MSLNETGFICLNYMEKGIQRHRDVRSFDWIYHVQLSHPPTNCGPREGLGDTALTKALRWEHPESSVVDFFE